MEASAVTWEVGEIRYREAGSGPALLFVHGILANGTLWRDVARFVRSVSRRFTVEAARSFPGFDRPVLIAWGLRDIFFSPRLALRLQHDFPDARLEAVPGSRAFVPEDRPERLAQLVREFVDETAGRPRAASDGSREGVFSGD
jgi:pimeloyl-ACP methyl ester carboxylesterase